MLEGLALGALSWGSLLFSGAHLPVWLKRFFIRRFIITDILTTGLTWLLIGGISHSLVAVVACVSSGFLMNLTMFGFNKGLLPMPESTKEKLNDNVNLQRVGR